MLSQGRGRGPNWGAQKEGEEGKLFTGSPPRAIHPHIPGFSLAREKPSYMLMDHDDQMNAWRVLMESTEWDTKEHFTFIFENIQDMETFMIICRDTLNLRVNAGHGVHSHPYTVC